MFEAEKTIEYYNLNANRFIADTVSVEFKITQERFANKLPDGACILDFIGNYEKAGKVLSFLVDEKDSAKGKRYHGCDIEYPDDCIIDFDMHLLDLFQQLDKKSQSIREKIYRQYYNKRHTGINRPVRQSN